MHVCGAQRSKWGVHGRRTALGTALGVNTGLLVWTAASAFGLAALLRASSVAFDALKFAGAIYLIWLGIQALRAAHRSAPAPTARQANPGPASPEWS